MRMCVVGDGRHEESVGGGMGKACGRRVGAWRKHVEGGRGGACRMHAEGVWGTVKAWGRLMCGKACGMQGGGVMWGKGRVEAWEAYGGTAWVGVGRCVEAWGREGVLKGWPVGCTSSECQVSTRVDTF